MVLYLVCKVEKLKITTKIIIAYFPKTVMYFY